MFYLCASFCMKNRYWLIVILFLLYNSLGSFFVFAEDKEQPAVCSWPSKEMSRYFDFQNEMRSALFNSDANEKLLTIWDSKWWLFTEWTLKLSSDVTAMDLVAGSVLWRAASIFSSVMTSYVLIMLASVSTVGSSVNSLAILFRDRPIVRDYREMMKIETKLFDAAFFRSQQINLTRPMEEWWNLQNDLNAIIEKYRKLWLLEDSNNKIRGGSMADIISDLITMNAAMKHFIVYWWDASENWKDFWADALRWYYWCWWNWNNNECVRETAILKFSEDAIEKLRIDYSWIGAFWACNLYKNNFWSTISKWINNNKTSVKAAMQDVENAHKRLVSALGGWDSEEISDNPCNNMSEYELAQLRAYWWSNWECWKWDEAPSLIEIKNFQKNKEAMRKQFEGVVTQVAESAKQAWSKTKDFVSKVFSSKTTVEKSQKWKEIFWTWVAYNPEFSLEMYGQYKDIYEFVMNDYSMSQISASASDLWVELGRIQWLVNQIDLVSDAIWEDSWEWLKKVLLDIVNYQCSE